MKKILTLASVAALSSMVSVGAIAAAKPNAGTITPTSNSSGGAEVAIMNATGTEYGRKLGVAIFVNCSSASLANHLFTSQAPASTSVTEVATKLPGGLPNQVGYLSVGLNNCTISSHATKNIATFDIRVAGQGPGPWGHAKTAILSNAVVTTSFPVYKIYICKNNLLILWSKNFPTSGPEKSCNDKIRN